MNDQDPEWAICCSGGGIRSATYCLGALQSLLRNGLYGKARCIVGVSGGSYIAASLALVRHGLRWPLRSRWCWAPVPSLTSTGSPCMTSTAGG
jgi:predicted acylesterase/phospholipase RssA